MTHSELDAIKFLRRWRAEVRRRVQGFIRRNTPFDTPKTVKPSYVHNTAKGVEVVGRPVNAGYDPNVRLPRDQRKPLAQPELVYFGDTGYRYVNTGRKTASFYGVEAFELSKRTAARLKKPYAYGIQADGSVSGVDSPRTIVDWIEGQQSMIDDIVESARDDTFDYTVECER